MVSGDFQSLSAFWYPQLSFMVMQVSQARPAFGGIDLLFRRGEIPRQAVAVVDNDVRLQLEHHLVHLLRFPLLGTERPIDVVPEDVNLSVLRHELADQAVRVFHKAHARRLIRQATRAVGVVPIHQGIIKAHAQTFGARRFHEFRHQVAAARLLGSAIVGELRFKIAEALMMLGGHHHVFLAGAFGELRPLARGVRLGRKVLRQ